MLIALSIFKSEHLIVINLVVIMNNNTGSAFHLNNTARRDLCQSTSNVRFQELIFLTDSNQISPINFKFFCNSYNYTHTTMHTINRVHMDEQKINLKVQQNINHMIFSLYCASIGDCFYSKKVLGEYLISLKRFLPLFDTITVDNLGQFSRELCKLDQITAP